MLFSVQNPYVFSVMDNITPPPPGQMPGQTDDFCRADIYIHSRGFWDNDPFDPRPFLSYSLPLLLVQLCIIFVLTQFLHLLMKRALMPRVVSELLVFILLRPIPFLATIQFNSIRFDSNFAMRVGFLAQFVYLCLLICKLEINIHFTMECLF